MTNLAAVSGLVGAGVLAAIMSSLDSQFVCLGTMFTRDIVIRKFGEDRFTDKQKVLIARGFILLIVAITYGLACALIDSAQVFALGVWCFTGFAGLFPLIVGSVYWKGTTKAGAISCILVTAATWCILFYRDIISQHPGAEEELLIAGMMPVTLIIAASAITLVAVSLLTKKPSETTLKKFFA